MISIRHIRGHTLSTTATKGGGGFNVNCRSNSDAMLFSKNYVILQSEGGGGGKTGQKMAIILNVWPLISLVLDCVSELYHSNDFFTKTYVSLYKITKDDRLQNFYLLNRCAIQTLH